jgi:BASS family bile acid:Na+ symporter
MNPDSIVKILTITGLIAITLSMGLAVNFDEVRSSMRSLRSMLLGLFANFVLVPAFTIGLLYLFDANPMVSAGFLILAVCPGAPVGPPFAAVAKGDVAFATGQMVLLAGLSAVLAPALLSVLLAPLLPASELRIDYLAIVRTLLVVQMLPLAIGVGLHRWAPKFASTVTGPVRLAGNLVLFGAIGLILASEYETLAMIRLRGWAGMLLLLLSCVLIGWFCGGPALATRKSLAVTTAARNAGVGLVIVSSSFANTAAVTAVIAFGLVSILSALGCAFLLAALPEPDDPLRGLQ